MPAAGDNIYLVGKIKPDFGGSQIEKLMHNDVSHTHVDIDLNMEFKRGEEIRKAVQNITVNYVQSVGKGGLAIKLAQISAHFNEGMDVKVDCSNGELFAETPGNYIVFTKDGEMMMEDAVKIGTFGGETFKVASENESINTDVSHIVETWKGAISQCMTSAV